MGKETGITWTNHTFNPWIGCTEVSPGCDNCYAAAQDKRWGHASWGKGAPRRPTSAAYWKQPPKWNREAELLGVRRMVFCASMADVMDDEAPEGMREQLWALIDSTPYLIWQLLTKRPHRYERYLPARFLHNNVWYGTTAENQEFYGVRWPILCELVINRGGMNWISYEPALGPLSIVEPVKYQPLPGINLPDWMICGGESGHGRRPFEQKWADDLMIECRQQRVPFFMKQMGGVTAVEGKEAIPEHLMVQQFPVIYPV